MSLYDSGLWMADINEVVASLPELTKMAKSSILITGATGLICSSVIDVIMRYNEINQQEKITVYAAGRSAEKHKQRFTKYAERSDLIYVPYDATRKNELAVVCDYIIHGASNTSPDTYLSEAVETMTDNFIAMKELLDYACCHSVKRTLYISSSEIYGQNQSNQAFGESEYGYIDLLNPRSSYAVSKRATETLCASYTYEYGIETVIVRPGHIYGPTAGKKDKRVASLWANSAAKGAPIIMKSDGKQIRSYCYCLDCASAILKVLIDGECGHAYNISNPEAIICIKEMAEIIAAAGAVEMVTDIPSEEEKKTFNPMNNSSLRSDSLESLGWKGLFDAHRGFFHTVKILQDLK